MACREHRRVTCPECGARNLVVIAREEGSADDTWLFGKCIGWCGTTIAVERCSTVVHGGGIVAGAKFR